MDKGLRAKQGNKMGRRESDSAHALGMAVLTVGAFTAIIVALIWAMV